MVGTSRSETATATFTNATVARTGDNFGFLIGDANGATVLNGNTPVASSGSVTLYSSTLNMQAITIVGKSNTAGTAAGTASLTLNGNSVINQTSPGSLNRAIIVGENLNSSGTVIVLPGRYANTTATLNLNDSSAFAMTAGYTSIAREGKATLNVGGSATFTATPNSDFNMGDVSGGAGTINLSGTGAINATQVYIG